MQKIWQFGIGLVAAAGIAHGASANLITNPGAESLGPNGAGTGNEIPGWTKVVSETWGPRDSTMTNTTVPHSGTYWFSAFASPAGELAQTVDVSSYASSIDAGQQQFDFGVWVNSWEGDDDSARAVVEYLDSSANVLDSYDSGEWTNYDHVWDELTDSRLAPAGTRDINVRLIATRHAGNQNNGYFDDVSLTTTTVPEPASLALLGLGGLAMLRRRRA